MSYFLDNEVARFGLIKGYSHASMVCWMANAIATHFERNLILPWFLRAPSSANICDFPSSSVEHPFLDKDFKLDSALVKNAFDADHENGGGAGA